MPTAPVVTKPSTAAVVSAPPPPGLGRFRQTRLACQPPLPSVTVADITDLLLPPPPSTHPRHITRRLASIVKPRQTGYALFNLPHFSKRLLRRTTHSLTLTPVITTAFSLPTEDQGRPSTTLEIANTHLPYFLQFNTALCRARRTRRPRGALGRSTSIQRAQPKRRLPITGNSRSDDTRAIAHTMAPITRRTCPQAERQRLRKMRTSRTAQCCPARKCLFLRARAMQRSTPNLSPPQTVSFPRRICRLPP